MLLPAKEDLVRRRWIWQALSDLFLDDEVHEGILCGIARTAAECGYTADELEAICRRELAPAVAFNLWDTAGVWGYFDTVWLEKRTLRSWGPLYWFERLILAPVTVWALRQEWQQIKIMLAKEHERVRKERRQQGEQWNPYWTKEAPCYRWGPGK